MLHVFAGRVENKTVKCVLFGNLLKRKRELHEAERLESQQELCGVHGGCRHRSQTFCLGMQPLG